MESNHEKILKELAAMEEEARATMQGVAEEKKAIESEAKEKQDAFDAEQEKATQEQLAAIREAFAKESEEEIARIRAETESTMAVLRETYEKQVDIRAEEIVRSILAGGVQP